MKSPQQGFAVDAQTRIMFEPASELILAGAGMLQETLHHTFDGLNIAFSEPQSSMSRSIVIMTVHQLPEPLHSTYQTYFSDANLFANIDKDYENQNYIIDVNPDYILVAGKEEQGAFYGIQTLIQLIQQKHGRLIPGVRIYDYPDLGVRVVHAHRSHVEKANEFERRLRHFAHLKYTHVIIEDGIYYGKDWVLQNARTPDERWVLMNAGDWSNVQSAFNLARNYGLEPVPSLGSYGWAHYFFGIDPHVAEGTYITDEQFVFDASNIAQQLEPVTILEEGFEEFTTIDEFSSSTSWSIDPQGGSVSLDENDAYQEGQSILIERSDPGTTRMWYDFVTSPNTFYTISAWLKIDGTLPQGTAYMEVYELENGELKGNAQPLWVGKKFKTTNSTWQHIRLPFNSKDLFNMRLYIRLEGGTGVLRIDDVTITTGSDYSLRNVLLTNASRISVTNLEGTTHYEEGRDFKILPGSTVWRGQFEAFNPADPSYKIERLEGGEIQPGQRVLVSYNQVTRVNAANVAYSAKEPRVHQIIKQVVEQAIDKLDPDFIHINHDEVFNMGTDSRDGNDTNADLFANNVQRWYNELRMRKDDIEVWMWGDMLDKFVTGEIHDPPTLNAIDLIPEDIVLLPWWYDEGGLRGISYTDMVSGVVEEFAMKGFRVMSTTGHHFVRGAYIDSQQLHRFGEQYGMVNTAWDEQWGPAENDQFWDGWYNWNNLIPTAQFAWHKPADFHNELDDAGWFYYDELEHPYYDSNGDVGSTGSAEFHHFNASFGDIYAARPTGVLLEPGEGRVYLQWQENQEKDISGYRVYQRKSGDIEYGNPVDVPGRSTTFLELSGVETGTEFVITALDTPLITGGVTYQNESAFSVPVTYTDAGGLNIIRSLIGDKDNFHSGDPADVPPQSQAVLDLFATRDPAENEGVNLDEGGSNRPVGLTHFFNLPQHAIVQSAELAFRFRGAVEVFNDGILYNQNGEPIPQIALKDVLGREPVAGGVYEGYIDLASVPIRYKPESLSSGASNPYPGDAPDEFRDLRNELLDGQFDVVFVDDVEVDYLELVIKYTTLTIDFTLIDAEKDAPVQDFDPIPQGAVLDRTWLPRFLNIRANVSDATESVAFAFNDAPLYHIENVEPYALFGDVNGDYASAPQDVLGVGVHSLTATPYSEDGAQGLSSPPKKLVFTIKPFDFTLIDASQDTPIPGFDPISDGAVLDLSVLPAFLNIQANHSSDITQSLVFSFKNNPAFRIEHSSPYTLFGDVDGNYASAPQGVLVPGSYTLTATPFDAKQAKGTSGVASSVTFTIINFPNASIANATADALQSATNIPDHYLLDGAYPNPFNPQTTLRFGLPENARVKLEIYDILGRKIRTLVDGPLSAGMHDVVFEAGHLASGIYLYRLETPQGSFLKKMLLLK